MKTKLTLLLAQASSVSLHAEKPNFNGARPAAQAPAPRSSPSYSGGHSSHSANVGQIIGIARSVLPLVMNAAPQQPRQAPPPPRPLPAKKSSAPVVNTKKPAIRINVNVAKPGSATRATPSGSHTTVSNAPAGIDSKLAADLKAGREIASGLQSLDSLRASFAAPEGFGDVFNQPGNPGRGDQGDLADPFNSDREYGSTPALPSGIDPSRRRGGSATGLRDIRGDMGKSRRAGDEDTDGSWNLGNGVVMSPDGSRHIYSSSDHQASVRHYNPDGKYAGRSEHSWNPSGSVTTTQHFDDQGHYTSTVVVSERADGTEQKTVYREGEEPVITWADDVPHDATPATQTCDRNPSDGASLGGSVGPRVGDVTGLMPIDLLCQFAEGKPSGGTTNYTITRHSGANQVRPTGEGQQTGVTTRAKPRVLTGQGLEGNGGRGGTDGGSGPDY